VVDRLRLSIDALLDGTGRTVVEELLEPTRIYVRAVLSLLAQIDVHAMANITGGGLPGNIPRVLPEGCRVVLRRSAWHVHPVFEVLRQGGGVTDDEMFRTFNMGIGYVVIVPPAAATRASVILSAAGETVSRIGEVVAGERGVDIVA